MLSPETSVLMSSEGLTFIFTQDFLKSGLAFTCLALSSSCIFSTSVSILFWKNSRRFAALSAVLKLKEENMVGDGDCTEDFLTTTGGHWNFCSKFLLLLNAFLRATLLLLVSV
uniref:Uncharacterized protein n=1 Tax=Opuntia streptacantha TaxID=393608 RepID=A0A7C9A139_OPUST